jgi:hypothetical protein
MNENQRYQRILRDDDRTEDPDDHMEVMSQEGSNSGRRVVGRLKRRGSHGSLGSFRSIDDDQINRITDDNDNDDHDDDHHIHPLEAERSPLRNSFDKDDNDVDEPPSHVDTSFAMPPAAAAVTASSSTVMMYSSSFDLDDDEDDDEADLKRYNLDFSRPSSTSTPSTNNINMLGTSMHDGSLAASTAQLSSDNMTPNSLPKYLWFSFQSLRQQARQRRAQRLLQQSERNYRQTLYLCVMTYCDATDRGILLVASIVMFWSLLIWKIQSHKTVLAATGITLFFIRVGARPCWEWYTVRRRERRQRVHTSDELHLHLGSGGGASMLHSASSNTPTTAATTNTVMRSNYYSDHRTELFVDEPSSSNTQLELQSMRRANGKANTTSLMETTTTTIVPKEADPVIHTV